MPNPGRDDSETPRPDARLLEFIAERRLAQARQRRQMIVLGATAGAALILLSVTVASLLLARPKTAPTPVASPKSAPAPPAAPPRVADAPKPPVPSAATRTVEPDRPAAPTRDPAASTRDPAPTTPSPEAARPSPNVPPASDVSESADPARRTASWLVQSLGRLEAENRAAMVAEFYSGERRAFWQRVLAEVRSIPDR